MVFTKEDGILIKVLRQSKGYSARKLLEEFPDKDWSCSALDRLLWQIDATESRQEVRQQQRMYPPFLSVPSVFYWYSLLVALKRASLLVDGGCRLGDGL